MSEERTDTDTGPIVGAVTGPQAISAPQLGPAASLGQQWRDRAVHVVRGVSPPTMALGTRTGGDTQVTQRKARELLDLALRVGEAMLSTGSSSADCAQTVQRLTDAYGVHSVHVDITYTSVTVSIHRGVHEDSLSVMRVIPDRVPDYTRLEGVHALVDYVCARAERGAEPSPEQAGESLERVLNGPHPYRPWVATAGQAVLGVGVVLLYGAAPSMWLVAAVSAILVDRLQRHLRRLGIPPFFTQAVCAAVPTTFGLILFALRSQGMDIPGLESPSLVVISGIVVLLAGLGMMSAAQDALDGFYVTAGARGLEVLLMTAGIAVGVAAVIGLGTGLGVSMEVAATISLGGSPPGTLVGALLIGLGFCLSTYAGLRATGAGMAVAVLGWVVFELLLATGMSTPPAAGIAAAPIGALAYAVHRKLRLPELAVETAGIVPLLPGMAVYRAIHLIQQDTPNVVTSAVTHFVAAVATGLALAAGLSIGGYLARRRLGLDVAVNRVTRMREHF